MSAMMDRDADRVRRHTSEPTLGEIDQKTRENVRIHGARPPTEISRRLHELEREWDVERTLEANASTLAMTGAMLGTMVSRKWFWLTGGVLGFLFQHAVSGWCPPLPFLRKLGKRTQNEIDQERYALKAVRGDLGSGEKSVGQAVDAVSSTEHGETGRRQREPDRVRRYTSRGRLRQLDAAMERRVRLYASQPAEVITERIAELRREWSIERYLQVNIAAVGITTATLAATRNRKWGFVTFAGLAFFLFHAVEGFDPPLPALRKAGLRSRAEINREVYALKILRGDFDHPADNGRIEAAIEAVAE
jgi:hypothetical protein